MFFLNGEFDTLNFTFQSCMYYILHIPQTSLRKVKGMLCLFILCFDTVSFKINLRDIFMQHPQILHAIDGSTELWELFTGIWSERNAEFTAYNLFFQNFKINSVTFYQLWTKL